MDPHVFNPGLFECAFCGERVATMRIMHEETDGVPLCQSCFGMVLKIAAQTPEYKKRSRTILTTLVRKLDNALALYRAHDSPRSTEPRKYAHAEMRSRPHRKTVIFCRSELEGFAL